jgi:hypothetical protein
MLARALGLAALAVAGIAGLSGPAQAHQLSLTPSHVFSTWTNINACLLAIAEEEALDRDLQQDLAAMIPGSFVEKGSIRYSV